MNNRYINIVNGEDIEMNDDQFAKSYRPFEQFVSDFFKDRNIEIKNINKMTGYTTEFDFIYNNIPFHAVYLNVKNSGQKSSERDKVAKRLQISNNFRSYDDEVPHFVIGSYNTNDKILYFIVELKEYIKNKSAGSNYSSFWLDYGDICATYERGFNRHVDEKRNRLIVGIDNIKVKEFEDDELINNVFPTGDYYENALKQSNFNSQKIIFESNDNTTYNAGIKLKRNNELKNLVFERENYTCELCGTKNTFEDKNGKEYFEGHHLIMYNISSQSKFKYSLDITENIICLCPTCHRKIHYADKETITDCVTKLLEKHMELYDIFEFEVPNTILENYIRYERDDDNE